MTQCSTDQPTAPYSDSTCMGLRIKPNPSGKPFVVSLPVGAKVVVTEPLDCWPSFEAVAKELGILDTWARGDAVPEQDKHIPKGAEATVVAVTDKFPGTHDYLYALRYGSRDYIYSADFLKVKSFTPPNFLHLWHHAYLVFNDKGLLHLCTDLENADISQVPYPHLLIRNNGALGVNHIIPMSDIEEVCSKYKESQAQLEFYRNAGLLTHHENGGIKNASDSL